MSSQYFDTCKRVVSELDAEALAKLELGTHRKLGGSFVFNSLGIIDIGLRGDESVGVKLPLRDGRSEVSMRFRSELALSSFAIHMSKGELGANFPSFMALLSIDSKETPVGILTEDVSDGGRKSVRGRQTSDRIRKLLYEPFRELGSIDEVLDGETCDHTLAFDVEGEEMLLDMTPSPIRVWPASTAYREFLYKATDLMPELTITIPSDSRLGSEFKV